MIKALGGYYRLKVDAIVNAANCSCSGRRSRGAIIGRPVRNVEECRNSEMPNRRARIRAASDSRPRYVIHTRGPVWNEDPQGSGNFSLPVTGTLSAWLMKLYAAPLRFREFPPAYTGIRKRRRPRSRFRRFWNGMRNCRRKFCSAVFPMICWKSISICCGNNYGKETPMKTELERFLNYIRFDTQSSDTTQSHPSTPGQWKLAESLAEELRGLSVERVRISEFAYVFGELYATHGLEQVPALGLIAHMDTSDAASGADIKPQTVEYDGGTVPLGTSGRVLDPALYPFLPELAGQTLITTDGTTLLGADDKAGIAEIMTLVERLVTEKIPHGKLCIGFTPDEEIGEGTLHFDVEDFGADYAYTVDGGAAGEIEFQNFNAAQAVFEITGRSVHPGSAKNIMISAQKVAFELDSILPQYDVP